MSGRTCIRVGPLQGRAAAAAAAVQAARLPGRYQTARTHRVTVQYIQYRGRQASQAQVPSTVYGRFIW